MVSLMQEVPKEQVLRRVALENPWWEPPRTVSEVIAQWTPRPYLHLLQPLVSDASVRRAVVLMGPRRVGKTVLLHHCISRLIEEGVPSTSICYLSIDNPVYVNLSLEDLLGLYFEATPGTPKEGETAYVFFDEIQYLPDWERHLKALVDNYPKLKFVASGSAAAALRLKSDESGAGRFTDFLLPPLTFYEYLTLLGRGDLVEIFEEGDTTWHYAPDVDALNEEFERYLNLGGYPEVAFSEAIQKDPGRFIKSDIVDKVLLRDLPSLYGIANIRELNSLFTSLAFNTAREISLEDLAQKSGVAKPTIKRYIEYLEAAFLLKVARRVDDRARYFQRQRNFKVYLTNASIRAALFGNLGRDDQQFGELVETGVFSQWLHREDLALLHYARWKRGEIDIVGLGGNQRPEFAVEVKWTDRFAKRPAKLKEAIKFCQQNNLSRLVVTSRTMIRNERIGNVELNFWPAALYCHAVGQSVINDRILSLEGQAARAT